MVRLNDSSLSGNHNSTFFIADSIVKEGENNNTVQITKCSYMTQHRIPTFITHFAVDPGGSQQ